MPFSTSASRLAALCLLALPALAAGQPPTEPPQSAGEAAYDLRQLVGRYIAWRGPAFGELQTVHERYYAETAAGRQPGDLWQDRQGRLRRETGAAGARVVEVATPTGGWRVGADGKLADDPGASERARRRALLDFGEAFTGRGGAVVTLAGTADLQDRTWSVVRIGFGDADVYEALIDPASGALCCYRITENGQPRTEMFGDWRLIDGVRMPFAEFVHAAGDSGLRVGAIELNRDFDPALFERPAG